jgi:hypothetical protein
MNSKGKSLTLLLILILAVSSMFTFKPANAQSVPKPSVPGFSVRFVDASYNVSSTNAYTGLSETNPVSNASIVFTVFNQPFVSPNYQLYFNIRVKPHYADNWTEIYPVVNTTSANNGDGTFSYALYIDDSPLQSTSGNTSIIFPVIPTDLYEATGYDIQRYYSPNENRDGGYSTFLEAIPNGAQLDFQVQALVGHAGQMWIIQHPFYPTIGGYPTIAVAYDTASGWSNTQTIIISGIASTTISPSESTPTPTDYTVPPSSPGTTAQSSAQAAVGVVVQGFGWTEIALIGTVAILLIVIVSLLMLLFRKHQTKA